MKDFFRCVFFLFAFSEINAQLIDSFGDGNFTSSPAWSSDSVQNWSVVSNSDASSGATNSYALRLNSIFGVDAIQYLSTQITNMASASGQTWGFFLGRRNQPFTTTNKIDVWLYANESNLKSATVDGYLISIGDNSDDDEILLKKITNKTTSVTIISSSTAITNGLEDIGILLRVTRTSAGVWTLYSSAIPTLNGSGAIASDVPSSSNVAVLLGSGTDNTYEILDNGYFGIVATHTSTTDARVTAELDQIYFDLSSSSLLPVELKSFQARQLNGSVILSWITATESANFGFDVERKTGNTNWEKIGFVKGNGTSTSEKYYTFKDDGVKKGKYSYRLKQIDRDGTFEYHKTAEVIIGLNPTKIVLDENYPNPFNSTTVISYQIPKTGSVQIKLYNLLGKEIVTIVNEIKEEGFHEVKFNSGNIPSGIYYYKLQSNNQTEIKKMVILK